MSQIKICLGPDSQKAFLSYKIMDILQKKRLKIITSKGQEIHADFYACQNFNEMYIKSLYYPKPNDKAGADEKLVKKIPVEEIAELYLIDLSENDVNKARKIKQEIENKKN